MTPSPYSTQPPPLSPNLTRAPGGPNAAFMRALFGPIMLLVVGILFAVDYAGGPSAGQTWPALIIVAGLLKLGEFMGARNV